jgi:hypothetical protein
MVPNEVGQRLHDRATRGEQLSEEERASLESWYAQQDAEEMAALVNTTPSEDVAALRKWAEEAVTQLQIAVRRTHTLLAENEKLRQEIAALRRQLAEGEDADIRQAYPLMDAVARAEGWDDPEMDSYNVYARKPQA